MATPPPVAAADASAAIERIAARRTQIDDPNAWRLSEDPSEVLLYLQKYSQSVPRWVAEADVLDGLTLRLRLWWQGEEAELWLLERSRRLGIAPRQIGRRLGVSSRQGVHDRLRLAREKVSRLTGDPPREDQTRPDQRKHASQQAWLARNGLLVLELAGAALEHRELADDEAAEWLAEVARDVRERAVTPGSVQTLRFALIELAASEVVATLPPDHPLPRLLSRWSELYRTWPDD